MMLRIHDPIVFIKSVQPENLYDYFYNHLNADERFRLVCDLAHDKNEEMLDRLKAAGVNLHFQYHPSSTLEQIAMESCEWGVSYFFNNFSVDINEAVNGYALTEQIDRMNQLLNSVSEEARSKALIDAAQFCFDNNHYAMVYFLINDERLIKKELIISRIKLASEVRHLILPDDLTSIIQTPDAELGSEKNESISRVNLLYLAMAGDINAITHYLDGLLGKIEFAHPNTNKFKFELYDLAIRNLAQYHYIDEAQHLYRKLKATSFNISTMNPLVRGLATGGHIHALYHLVNQTDDPIEKNELISNIICWYIKYDSMELLAQVFRKYDIDLNLLFENFLTEFKSPESILTLTAYLNDVDKATEIINLCNKFVLFEPKLNVTVVLKKAEQISTIMNQYRLSFYEANRLLGFNSPDVGADADLDSDVDVDSDVGSDIDPDQDVESDALLTVTPSEDHSPTLLTKTLSSLELCFDFSSHLSTVYNDIYKLIISFTLGISLRKSNFILDSFKSNYRHLSTNRNAGLASDEANDDQQSSSLTSAPILISTPKRTPARSRLNFIGISVAYSTPTRASTPSLASGIAQGDTRHTSSPFLISPSSMPIRQPARSLFDSIVTPSSSLAVSSRSHANSSTLFNNSTSSSTSSGSRPSSLDLSLILYSNDNHSSSISSSSSIKNMVNSSSSSPSSDSEANISNINNCSYSSSSKVNSRPYLEDSDRDVESPDDSNDERCASRRKRR